jgi:hypothetical protein
LNNRVAADSSNIFADMQRVLAAAEGERWERTQRAIATHRKATTRDRASDRDFGFVFTTISTAEYDKVDAETI